MFGRIKDVLEGRFTVFESPANKDRVVKYEHPIPAGEALAFTRNCDNLLKGSLPPRLRRFDDPEDNYLQALNEGAGSEMFGNPKFEDDYWTQDRVRPLKEAYSESDKEDKKTIIDR